MRSPFGIGAGLLVSAFALTTVSSAMADWPTARHDPGRSGVSGLGSDIKKPAPYWRSRLGGAPTSVYLGDVNKDGAADILFVAGGVVALADARGSFIWRTPSAGYNEILGVVDLDQNGIPDVILGSPPNNYVSPTTVTVLSGATGVVEWAEPAGELGTLGALRVGDLDADGSQDLWLDTCGCCSVETGGPGVVYNFKDGFASPVKLGPLPTHIHCLPYADTLGDFLGDGHLEMVQMNGDTVQMIESDGTILATSGHHIASRAQCEAINLDGQPGDELLCFSDAELTGGVLGLFALGYSSMPTPSLNLLWQFSASALAGGDAEIPTAPAVDLDGDGQLEVVVSGEANGVYTTYVLDGKTGTQLATVQGTAVGDVPAIAVSQRWLLIQQNGALSAYSFTRTPAALTSTWQVSGQQVETQHAWALSLTSGLNVALVTPNLGGSDPTFLLGSMSDPVVLSAYNESQSPPTVAAQYAAGTGITVTSVGTSTGFTSPDSLVVARNDGFLALLDAGLSTVNRSQEGTVTLPGMFAGGYYVGPGSATGFGHAPVAAKLEPSDVGEAVLVVDSTGALVRIDATGASNVAPAQPTWRLPDSFGASIQTGGATNALIGAFRRRDPVTNPPQYVMATISSGGQEMASLALPGVPQYDVLPGQFSGSSTGFVGLANDVSGVDIIATTATGQQVWKQNWFPSFGTDPFAVGDWNGDGVDDVAVVSNNAVVYSGSTGAALATGTDSIYFFMPILTNLEAGSQVDMLMQGGYGPGAEALKNDLTPLWTSSGPKSPLPFGALATCPSGSMLVEGNFSTPAQLTLTQASGATAGTMNSIVLASGASYPDAATATGANASQGQLTDVAISTDLDGTSAGPTALVGSTDGYLYAVDACGGALRWALQFAGPVGSPVLADTDGDGKDEILVSVNDGYLYVLKNEVLPAPAYVLDIDPPHGITNTEVSQIETVNTLYATWASVPGAASYELAVANAVGNYVTSPSWVSVGSATTASIPNLPLVNGAKYFVGVRAVSDQGTSPDTPSPGVVVILPTMDGGSNADGGTDASVPDAGGSDGGGGTADNSELARGLQLFDAWHVR